MSWKLSLNVGGSVAFVMHVNLEQEANARVFVKSPLPFHKNSDHGLLPVSSKIRLNKNNLMPAMFIS